MKLKNLSFSKLWVLGVFVFFACGEDDPTPPMMDTSFYATQLGGETMVPDPDNPGQMVEQGFFEPPHGSDKYGLGDRFK